MSRSLKDYVQEQSTDPQERAATERHLEAIGDAEPVGSAYWRAMLDGDAKTIEKILISKRIFRLREKAKHSPIFADLLQHQIDKLKTLESA